MKKVKTKKVKDIRNPEIVAEAKKYGYKVTSIEKLDDKESILYTLEHTSGARHIHLSCPDEENTFSVAFKTVPKDSTGVAHILEHTVLCGSKRYPVRDPFFSMLKRSLSTFMNAFTASDWTMYPFSTQNEKDFYNLMGVYLDATFFPKIDELSFKQEGHRLEYATDEKTKKKMLEFMGVVYNEMKGAMSSPDQIMVRNILKALFPDTTYSENSGGDPKFIPDLTHEQLKEFHRNHYQPANAFFYTYGNLPLINHLKFINEKVLKKVKTVNVNTEVKKQPRWKKPQNFEFSYPLENEDPLKKNQVCLAWLTCDINDTLEVLTLEVLERALLVGNASPLKRALIDSELGSALSDGSGFDDDSKDTLFVAGLKDVELKSAEKIEKIILETLNNLSKKGIEKNLIINALHQIELREKNKTNEPYPYGIKRLLKFVGPWIHDGDPVNFLRVKTAFINLRKRMEKDSRYFEKKIKEYFLDNPHRARIVLEADPELMNNTKLEIKKCLAKIEAKLSKKEKKSIIDTAAELKKLQEKKEDNIDVLPTLERDDIPTDITTNIPVDSNKQFSVYGELTEGVDYITAVAGLRSIDKDLIPLLPLFCHTYTKLGTDKRNFISLDEYIKSCTGGIGLSPEAHTKYSGKRDPLAYISISSYCLDRNKDKMKSLIRELILAVNFNNHDQLKKLLIELRAMYESEIIHNGHRLAISLASRNFSRTNSLSEILSGVSQIRYLKEITEGLDENKLKDLANSLNIIKKVVMAPPNFMAAYISGNPNMESLDFLSSPDQFSLNNFQAPQIDLNTGMIREAWITSTAVSFVSQVFKTAKYGDKDAPALAVISKLLRDLILHREIREKGGAYGGFAVYSPETGLFGFASYRDPHIVNTLNVYEQANEFIMSGKFTDNNVKESILQVCSEIDKPNPPGPAARKAFVRDINGLSDDARQTHKARLISLTKKDIVAAANKFFDNPKKSIVVISNEDKIKEANEKLIRLKKQPLELHQI